MSHNETLSHSGMWGILLLGLMAGLFWVLPEALGIHARWALYVAPLSLCIASVLGFTLTRLRAVTPWLCALLVVPFATLMTGWLHWNFPASSTETYQSDNIAALLLLLFLVMPLLQTLCLRPTADWGNTVLSALWRNAFTLLATGLITGLFWLVMLLWSRLFSLIGLNLFERLFFDSLLFPPMATGLVIAAGVALCRTLSKAAAVFRQLITLIANLLLPLHALATLLFLACLPFTGLGILPDNLSAAGLLSTMAAMMLVLTAMTGAQTGAITLPRGLARLVLVAQFFTPLLVALAAWALWLRVQDYGWTAERVRAAAAIVTIALAVLLLVWRQRRAWFAGAMGMQSQVALTLGLMAFSWFLLHTPVADPYRIEVASQLNRYNLGLAKVDDNDIYSLSHAGRRGRDALRIMSHHPNWLSQPGRQKAMLVQVLAGGDGEREQGISVTELQRHVQLRQGSRAVPASWWQSQVENPGYSTQSCLYDNDACIIWLQDMNQDGTDEVLLYNRHQQVISLYTMLGTEWRQQGSIPLADDTGPFEQRLLHGQLGVVNKPWRDLEIDGQRYPVQYYGVE